MTYPRGALKRCAALGALLALAACPKDQPGTSDDATGTGTGTGTGTSDDSTPTGPAESTLCQETCVHLGECGSILALNVAGCVSMCEGGAALKDTDACKSSVPDWYTCLRDAPCDDTQPGPGGVCALPFADYTVSCSGCPTYVEREGELCIATVDCIHGFAVDFTCEGDTCTCTLDSEPFATCPAAGVCVGDDLAVRAAAQACCGMPFDGETR